MMVLAILAAGAVGTQLVAPFLRSGSARGLLAALVIACAMSVALVAPYPRRPAETATSERECDEPVQ